MSKSKRRRHAHPMTTWAILALTLLAPISVTGCGPSLEELDAVDFTPLIEGDLNISTPEEQGLDPLLLARLFYEAESLETLYGLLVIKNGVLIAEKYFNEESINQASGRQ